MQPFYLRLLDACYGLLLYARNLVLPDSLCAHYPYPALTGYNLAFLYTGVVAGVILLSVMLIAAIRRSRLIAFSLLFTAVNLFLMLKLVPVSDFIAADRYAYVASAGFCLLAAGAVARFIEFRPNRKMAALVLFCGYLLTLALATNAQCRLWNNSLVLWDNVVSHYPRDTFAIDMRGNAKVLLADFAGAIADYDLALKQNPGYARSYVNRGYALSKQGKWAEAIADYERAIVLEPGSFPAINNLSVARYEMKDYEGAAAAASRAITLSRDPLQAGLAYHNRGRAEAALGNSARALEDFSQSLAFNPGYYPSWTCRAGEKIKRGDCHGALEDIGQAIRIDPADQLARILKVEAQHRMNDGRPVPAVIIDALPKDPVLDEVPGRP
jgi:tetratricopeptide (TPR) repeat protein